jgi:MFS family permease
MSGKVKAGPRRSRDRGTRRWHGLSGVRAREVYSVSPPRWPGPLTERQPDTPCKLQPCGRPFCRLSPSRFRALFHGPFLSTFGLQIISVSVGWQIYDLTRDPFDLGLVGLIQFLPALVLILFTGSAADRYGRRTIMMICEIVIGFALAAGLLRLARSRIALPIFAVLLVIGISRAFFAPASQSLAPNLVPASDLPNAIAWNSTSWQTATIVGPVAGGLLYGLGRPCPI